MSDPRREAPGSGAAWATIGVILVLFVLGLGAAGFLFFRQQQEAVRHEEDALRRRAMAEAVRAEEDGSGRRVTMSQRPPDALIHWPQEHRWILHSRREGLTKVVLGVDLPPPDLDQDALVVRPGLDVTGLAGLLEVSPTAFHTHVDVARLPTPDELETWCVVESRSWDEVRRSLLPAATPDQEH